MRGECGKQRGRRGSSSSRWSVGWSIRCSFRNTVMTQHDHSMDKIILYFICGVVKKIKRMSHWWTSIIKKHTSKYLNSYGKFHCNYNFSFVYPKFTVAIGIRNDIQREVHNSFNEYSYFQLERILSKFPIRTGLMEHNFANKKLH